MAACVIVIIGTDFVPVATKLIGRLTVPVVVGLASPPPLTPDRCDRRVFRLRSRVPTVAQLQF
jgi:hypothetical protein